MTTERLERIENARRAAKRHLDAATSLALQRLGNPSFDCPACGRSSAFLPAGRTNRRPFARCANCGSLERHRHQILALEDLERTNPKALRGTTLHFAPERLVQPRLSRLATEYSSGDIEPGRADRVLDLRKLDVPSNSVDLVYASHVIEHVDDDEAAFKEISRVLRPHGIAILPLPVVCTETTEYTSPAAEEYGHVRAVGADYFDRPKSHFSSVEVLDSSRRPDHLRFQLMEFDDRTVYPTSEIPDRPPSNKYPSPDFIMICHA